MGSDFWWSTEEIGLLQKNYNSLSTKQLLDLFPDRSWRAITQKASRMKLSRNKVVPSLEPSEALAYIVGVLKGDGWISGYKIGLNVVSQRFANNFASALQSIGLSSFVGRKPTPYRLQYRAGASSKMFTEWYRKLSLDSIKKMLRTERLKTAFLRGFYESEGSVWLDKRRPSNYYCLGIYNTDVALLNMVVEFSVDIGFPQKPLTVIRKRDLPYKTEYAYRLNGAKAQAFISKIQPSIKARPNE